MNRSYSLLLSLLLFSGLSSAMEKKLDEKKAPDEQATQVGNAADEVPTLASVMQRLELLEKKFNTDRRQIGIVLLSINTRLTAMQEKMNTLTVSKPLRGEQEKPKKPRPVPTLQDLKREDAANLLKEGLKLRKKPKYWPHAAVYFKAASLSKESTIRYEALLEWARLCLEQQKLHEGKQKLRKVLMEGLAPLKCQSGILLTQLFMEQADWKVKRAYYVRKICLIILNAAEDDSKSWKFAHEILLMLDQEGLGKVRPELKKSQEVKKEKKEEGGFDEETDSDEDDTWIDKIIDGVDEKEKARKTEEQKERAAVKSSSPTLSGDAEHLSNRKKSAKKK
jgi:hypothetical protein